MAKKKRVVIADDSALMRKMISHILNSDPRLEVVALARDGKQALAAVHALKPDVVALDIEMPILDGLDALCHIMSEIPTPCVMISAFSREGSLETIRALELGAIDFVGKPGGVISRDIDKMAREIIKKIRTAAGIRVEKIKRVRAEMPANTKIKKTTPGFMSKVFVVASSTGGTQALATVIPALRSDFPAAVLVVQHMPPRFTRTLSERLGLHSKIRVVEADDQMPIKPAQVIIAKGGFHMEVAGDMNSACITLTKKPPQLGLRPCANVTMESTAKTFKYRAVGLVLSGMGSDGTIGAQAIKSNGGIILVEHKSSCVVYGMPRSIIDAGLADKIVTLRKMAGEMERLV